MKTPALDLIIARFEENNGPHYPKCARAELALLKESNEHLQKLLHSWKAVATIVSQTEYQPPHQP